MKQFMDWIISGKEVRPSEPKDHQELGKSLGLEATKDAYGNGPEEHGSAWKIEDSRRGEVEKALEDLGFTPDKKRAKWKKGSFVVEVGESEGTLWIYITDDNGIHP